MDPRRPGHVPPAAACPSYAPTRRGTSAPAIACAGAPARGGAPACAAASVARLAGTAALLSLLATSGACASRQGPNDPPRPDASGWVSPRFRDHPLVGKIWRPAAGAYATEAELRDAVTRARFVLLGETHDNADHHLGQARLLAALTAAGRKPALGLEMLDVDRQPVVDAALARKPGDALALAAAVDWNDSGWPTFGLYRPVVEAGLSGGMPIVAANLPRRDARLLFSKGPSALPEPVRTRLDKAGPFPPDVLRVLRKEMVDSHCGELPEAMVEPMVTMQKAKDAQLAERLVSSDRGQGSVLIAGRGHVRGDIAVPMFLRQDAKPEEILAVGFVEVSRGAPRPEDYAAEYGGGSIPLDFVVFTPAAEREDPCVKFLEGKKEREAAHKAAAEKVAREKAAAEKAAAEQAGAGKSPTAPAPTAPAGKPPTEPHAPTAPTAPADAAPMPTAPPPAAAPDAAKPAQ